MRTRHWLSDCVLIDTTRPHLCVPFLHEHDGHQWEAATDGHGMVLLKGNTGTFPPVEGQPPLHKCVPERADWYRCDLEDLRHWCAPTTVIVGWDCNECDGADILDDVSQEGLLVGVGVTKRVLWKFIRYLPGNVDGSPTPVLVSVEGALDPIVIKPERGDDWIVVVMPRRVDESCSDEFGPIEPPDEPQERANAK